METLKEKTLALLKAALAQLQAAKPNDRSEVDRRYAVTITEQEKVIAYYDTFINRAKE